MLENTANNTSTSPLMDLSFLDGVPSFIGEEEPLENQTDFLASTVATSATSATSSEVFTIVDDFIFSAATCSATSATCREINTTDLANTMSFVDYVLQDCPDGPVMNPTDKEIAEAGLRAELEHIATYGTEDMTFAHEDEVLGNPAIPAIPTGPSPVMELLLKKLGEHATSEQIQGLASLMSDAKLLKIEQVVPRLCSGMLMTNQKTGKPLRCMDCGHRRHVEGSAWWIGECDVCGERKGNKDCCSVVV